MLCCRVLSTVDKKGEYNQAGSFCQSKSVEILEISGFKGVLICIPNQGNFGSKKSVVNGGPNRILIFSLGGPQSHTICRGF